MTESASTLNGSGAAPVSAVERLAAQFDRHGAALEQILTDLDLSRSVLGELTTREPMSLGHVLVPAEEATAYIARLMRHCAPLVRSMVLDIDRQPGADTTVFDIARERRRSENLRIRTVYPASLIGDRGAQQSMRLWADIGEEQRIVSSTATELAVFGDDAVMTYSTWGDMESSHCVIRAPLHVATFTAYFDQVWAVAQPVGELSTTIDDSRLIDLLGLGLKDEGIARYLGLSLRTVRRRIAVLMEYHNVETRFQLGYAVARRRDSDAAR